MKNLLLGCLLTMTAVGVAQVKYIDPQYQVEVDDLRSYGENFSYLNIFLGVPMATPTITPVSYRAYRPANMDDQRPVVIISHTGSYMPIPFNGGLTGSINDRAIIELASRFAARGYVAITPEYRAGWATQSTDIDVQTSTLLLASLRGAQDMHMLRRYLSHTVENENNFLGIDSSRVMILGLGTGGYNALNSNFLDNSDEVNRLSKFVNPGTGELYYNPAIDGDVYGVTAAGTNNPQWTDHANGWSFVVNAGGAMGDSSWIDGIDIEAPVIAMQSTEDVNAPYGIESIQVPTTMNTVLQDAPGGRIIVEVANNIGLNDALDTTNQRLLSEGDVITQRISDFSDDPFTTPIQGFETTLSTENFYPFRATVGSEVANRYNWVDTAAQGPVVRGIIAATSFPASYAQLLGLEQLANPNILDSAAAAAYQDTMMQFILPRAYAAMELNELVSSVVDITPADVELQITPNPASESVQIAIGAAFELRRIQLVNFAGSVVFDAAASGQQAQVDVSALAPGIYSAYLNTSEGFTAQRLLVK